MNHRALEFIQNHNVRPTNGFSPMPTTFESRTVTATHIDRYISNFQFERLAHDIWMWREAIREAEMAYYPMRVRMIRMFLDIVENPAVKPIIDRLIELTTQRDYIVYKTSQGKKKGKSDVLTQALSSPEQAWFGDYIKYTVDALLYGYSLISMGDIRNDAFPDISFVPRENIRPDGIAESGPILSSMIYAVDGIRVEDDGLIDMFNHWIPTPSNTGKSKCGYGVLYNAGLFEIHLRHILEWNMDYIEAHGQPVKVGSTKKTGKERDIFESFLANAASNQWILLDPYTEDKIDYVMAQNAGTAWKCYENLDDRLEGKLCRLLLGHEDALRTSKDKLGGMQANNKDGNNINFVQQALNAKQIKYGDFTCRKINEVLAPRLRAIGRRVGSKILKELIPEGYSFGLLNDTEENELQAREDNHRTKVSAYVRDLNDAGWDVDEQELSDTLGMKVKPMTPERIIIQNQNRTTKSEVIKSE